jgi:hypothetical protein
MTTGIFAYDGFIDPAKYDGYKIFIANPLMPGDLAQQLNAGIINLMDSGCDNIVFLGNGCTPQDATIQSHVEQLETHLFPLITCGRILHSDTHWKDYREVGAAKRLNLFNTSGTIIQNSSVLTNGYGVSIGNFAMNRAAIDRMNRFAQLYFDYPGPLPRLDNSRAFGYSKVLSLCAWCARVTIFMLPTGCNNAVMYHSRGCNPYASNSCDGDDSGDALKHINEEMAKQPLGLDFFDSPRD